MEKENTPKAHVSEAKKKNVEKLAKLINENRTILVSSIKGLPASQFQEIKKKLKKDADIQIMKKSTIQRALDVSKKKVQKLKDSISENYAILFSQKDPFELSLSLSENKTFTKAKPGQIAEQDINIEAGPTELVPGPAISELGSLGIKIAIENGKINIKQGKTIVKKGEEINETAAGIMGKLDIKPFSVSLKPLAAYDTESEKVFENIEIDKQETLKQLKDLFAKTKGFAFNIGYVCKETIGILLGKANAEAEALSGLVKGDKPVEKKEEVKEEKIESEKEDSDNDKTSNTEAQGNGVSIGAANTKTESNDNKTIDTKVNGIKEVKEKNENGNN